VTTLPSNHRPDPELGPGYRPASPAPELAFTAVISLESNGRGTKYSALAMHGDAASRENHAEQGFHEGWGTALDQLVSLFGPSIQEK
jgi:uncharacterized protein YndB with AHSA1/START domain